MPKRKKETKLDYALRRKHEIISKYGSEAKLTKKRRTARQRSDEKSTSVLSDHRAFCRYQKTIISELEVQSNNNRSCRYQGLPRAKDVSVDQEKKKGEQTPEKTSTEHDSNKDERVMPPLPPHISTEFCTVISNENNMDNVDDERMGVVEECSVGDDEEMEWEDSNENNVNNGDDERVGVVEECNVSDDEEMEWEDDSGCGDVCYNCRRQQYTDSGPYKLIFRKHTTNQIRPRKFMMCKSTESEENNRDIILCEQCSDHLIMLKQNRQYGQSKYTWPSYVWSILNNEDVKMQYGNDVWKLIPRQWRLWWINELRESDPAIYDGISIENPPCAFVDRTEELTEWNENMNIFTLPRLKHVANKLMKPVVLCPWGCTDYIHRSHHIPLDTIIQRYLRKVYIKLTMKKEGDILNAARTVESAREDFFDIGMEPYEWIFNKELKQKPSIIMTEKEGAVAMCCREHKGGCKNNYIHPPSQPFNNLPAKWSDQLCHCVIQSRTVRPVKRNGFSDSFQMHEQRGTFSGIDTCSLCSFGKFDKTSVLLRESEGRSIAHRPDINSLLNKLVEDKIITKCVAEGLRKDSERIMKNKNVSKYTKGATYVPLDVAMSLQKETLSLETTAILDKRDNNQEDIQVKFRKMWPEDIYPCQRYDDHGAIFPPTPVMNMNINDKISKTDVMLAWRLSEILTSTSLLWKTISNLTLKRSDWFGWYLVHLTGECFPELARGSQDTRDIFKRQYMSDIENVVSKIKSLDHENAFSNISNVLEVKSIDENFEEPGDDKDVIIVHAHKFVTDEDYRMNIGKFELTSIISTFEEDDSDSHYGWGSYKYSRHGGNHSKWWYRERHQKVSIQKDLPTLFDENQNYTLVYTRRKEIVIEEKRTEFLKYLGGQTHIVCETHKCPLIASYERDRTCDCGKTEFYRCCNLSCKCRICKKCASNKDTSNINFVKPPEKDNLKKKNQKNDDEETNNEEQEKEIPIEYNNLNEEEMQNGVTYADESYMGNYFNDDDIPEDYYIPKTNSGDIAIETEHEIPKNTTNFTYVAGHVVMNQCGTCLASRKKHEIKGSSKHKFFLHRICATATGESIPLLYPEGMLFPSIFWKMVDDGSILGSIPAPLLTENTEKFGFATIKEHTRTRLTSCNIATSTNPRYIAYCFDCQTNIMANHTDTRLIMNRGMTVDQQNKVGIAVKGIKDNKLLGSIDSKQMVKNLCASMKYHHMDYFLTFTCNQSKHFGVSEIKRFLNEGGWKDVYPGYKDLADFEQKEIDDAVHQASSGIMLRNWQETILLFINFLSSSPHSPYGKVLSIFARNEYQKDVGNLSHIHMLLEVNWKKLNQKQTEFVENLIRTNILEIVKPGEELKALLEDGTFKNMDDYASMLQDAKKHLPHRCSERCYRRTGTGEYELICRKWNNAELSKNPTQDTIRPLPNDLTTECNERLVKCGLAERIVKQNGETTIKYKHSFFYPGRHIPRTNIGDDRNISPVEGSTFSCTRSMQNVQKIKDCGGSHCYVCKYLTKQDEKNKVIMKAKQNNILAQERHVHNTKITSSKINEEKKLQNEKRNRDKPAGRAYSHNEIMHVLLGYDEVITNMEFINLPSVPLQNRPGVQLKCGKKRKSTSTNNNNNTVHGARRKTLVLCPNVYYERTKISIKTLRNYTINIIFCVITKRFYRYFCSFIVNIWTQIFYRIFC